MSFDGRILSGVSVLAAVVEGGSFVKGAELIGITDSGVSRAIGRLEARLGVRLLDRTTRSVTLTDEGRRFYEEVKPHLNAIEDAAVVVSGSASAVRGRLKVDIDPFFLPLVLAGRLGGFCERYPDLSIEFVTREHVGDLVAEGIDLAIRFGQPRFASLVARKLIEAPILTVASPRYLERHGRPAHPRDLSAHRCLQFVDPYTGKPFEWEFIRGDETIDVPTSGPLTFTDPKTMLDECLAGTGIAQVIGWGIGQALARGSLIDLFPDWHGERFPLFAFHPSRKHPPAKVRAFVDFCADITDELER
ncbi:MULTISPECIES: LysR family transcriptional regulator [unclassified Rhizobium]|uniref:LysR family transcriptional regulator n=1 Tax=unclassified Rhizobium TaxID=2613769 RepID=UPI000DE186B6|nr:MULTISPECIES: LysR family transcriptional regulator [unclassified Rhizobium]MBB3286882.1 DNA-binding transcriptional LysR family regulator [Rhizobium sp. BK252]MBB3401622.1 DNA-binding transcriptional LysR family regulator [Rhizobium sp. BK289]MBB3414434.1 DNA-binding transcriptional LysR family regulator [Rhizobium sp. BK284]MBB3482322.1 DNA-binding transcriptional LysR family regulator [Rhizobium sp. BK347]MDK4718378.1 LysR family transcriptional regulator [Rhizobium sp. CNPSo 3968]